MLASWSTTLHGALAVKGSLFRFKNLQTPHFAPKKKTNYGQYFGQILSLPLLSLISLPNTSKHLRFSHFLYNLQGSVIAPNLPLLGSIPWI